jgi:hypothetical protein
VVASGRYSYERFVTEVITAALGEVPQRSRGRWQWRLAQRRVTVSQRASRSKLAARHRVRRGYGRLSRIAVRILPDRAVAAIRRLRGAREARSG